MHNRSRLTGWLLATFVIAVWGSTFISSKILLEHYTPAQIMLTRFLLAYGALWLLRPRRLVLSRKQEAAFLVMGLSGCSIYFYAENSALTYTLASNVSILVAAAPIFTAILAHFTGLERFRPSTLWGFLTAFTGVILVVCNGAFVLRLNPRGDLLALAAAGCWAVYSVLLRQRNQELDPVLVTRRTLFWGILTAVPIVLLEGEPYPAGSLLTPAVAGNFLFLGLIGSGLCYVLWNRAIRLLGVVATNNFIYLNPFVTMVTARIFLEESISPTAMLGAVLITAGVAASQRSPRADAGIVARKSGGKAA